MYRAGLSIEDAILEVTNVIENMESHEPEDVVMVLLQSVHQAALRRQDGTDRKSEWRAMIRAELARRST